MSHQSNIPPPPPLGATTVKVAVAEALFAPAGPVESALAAKVLTYVPGAALFTGTVIEHVPFAGMSASFRTTLVAVLDKDTAAPPQVVARAVAATAVAMLRLAGSVSVRFACVSAKPLALCSVIVSVDTAFGATLTGANASLMVGAAGTTISATGHAPVAGPAVDGVIAGLLMAPVALTASVVVSTALALSVTMSVSDPAPEEVTETCAAFAPD